MRDDFIQLESYFPERQRAYGIEIPTDKDIEINGWGEELKKDFFLVKDDKQYLIVIISDAHTHAERLAFLGKKEENDTFSIGDMYHVSGRMAMMIHGGNHSSMRKDEVYLRNIKSRIQEANRESQS